MEIKMNWLLPAVVLFFANKLQAEPIYFQKYYPAADKASPAIILLHTSGGYKSVTTKIKPYTDAGYVVYTPDFFKRYGITTTNVFAVGFSNGGYWASYLSATGSVNAGISHYGVWDFPGNVDGYPVKYFHIASNPVLALIGKNDQTQRYERVLPQVQKAEKLSPRVVWKIYEASHSWDCLVCNQEYIYNDAVTKDAFKSTLDFIKENTK